VAGLDQADPKQRGWKSGPACDEERLSEEKEPRGSAQTRKAQKCERKKTAPVILVWRAYHLHFEEGAKEVRRMGFLGRILPGEPAEKFLKEKSRAGERQSTS